jgi:hypothetical protein
VVYSKIDVNEKKEDVAKDELNKTSLSQNYGVTADKIANYGEALAKGIIAKDKNDNFVITEGSEGLAKEMGITEEFLKSYRTTLVKDEAALREYGKEIISLDEQTSALREAMAI